MPRYLVMIGDYVYGDVFLERESGDNAVRAAERADAKIGSTARSYRTVLRSDVDAEYEVHLVDPSLPPDQIPVAAIDARYLSSVAATRDVRDSPRLHVVRGDAPGVTLEPSRSARRVTARVQVDAGRAPSLYRALDTTARAVGSPLLSYDLPSYLASQIDAADRAAAALSEAEIRSIASGSDAERIEIAAGSSERGVLVEFRNVLVAELSATLHQ